MKELWGGWKSCGGAKEVRGDGADRCIGVEQLLGCEGGVMRWKR